MQRRLRWAAVTSAAVAVGCNAILSLDHYRPCQGAECDGGGDGGTTADAQGCSASSQCPASSPVCSAGVCASVVSLARGMSNFTCVVLSDHTARCWGQNDRGQTGNGTTSAWVSKPVVVVDSSGSAPLTNVHTIVTGLGYACALTLQGQVYCWGMDAAAAGVIATLVPLSGVTQITGAAGVNSGEGTVCALRSGAVSCWGFNGAGRMGCTSPDGGASATLTPQTVSPNSPGPLPVTSSIAVAAGTNATCSLFGGGGGFECFGSNTEGYIGNGQTAGPCCNSANSLISRPTDRIEPSDFFTCAHDNMNAWWCWGLSQGGAILGVPRGQYVTSPTKSAADGTYSDLSPGWYHSCAITSDANANVQCWGQYDHGQMGDNLSAPPPAYSAVAVTAHGLSKVTQLAAHRNFTCALNGDGQVYCWGQNDNGWLLGAGSPSGDVKEPKPVVWD